MKKLMVLWALGFSGFLSAQEWKTVSVAEFKAPMEKLAANMRKNNTRLFFTKEVFNHFSDTKPATVSAGKMIIGSGLAYRSESDGITTIQTKELKMAIDSSSRIVFLMRPDSLFNPAALGNIDASVKDYSIRTRKEKAITIYQLNPSNLKAQQTIEIWLNEAGQLVKLIVLLPEANYFSDVMGDVTTEIPRIEMNYKKPVSFDPLKENCFDLSEWIIKKEKSYVLSPLKESNYTLQDLRYEPAH